MFKIGEFSKLSQVSIKTLRFYDEIGLFSPAQVDAFTGYRYYAADQLPRLNRILVLKDLGFALEDIARMVDDALSWDAVRDLLHERQRAIVQQIDAERARLARIETRLRQIAQEDGAPVCDVVLKQSEPFLAASLRRILATYSDVGQLLGDLFARLAAQRIPITRPVQAIYHDAEYREQDCDIEVLVPIRDRAPAGDAFQVREVYGGPMATAIHQGPYDEIGAVYTAIMIWVGQSQWRIQGPSREIYLRGMGDGIPPAEYVTEVQFPVEAAR